MTSAPSQSPPAPPPPPPPPPPSASSRTSDRVGGGECERSRLFACAFCSHFFFWLLPRFRRHRDGRRLDCCVCLSSFLLVLKISRSVQGVWTVKTCDKIVAYFCFVYARFSISSPTLQPQTRLIEPTARVARAIRLLRVCIASVGFVLVLAVFFFVCSLCRRKMQQQNTIACRRVWRAAGC